MSKTFDTINNFSLENGHDRRTITRRLMAAGIKPASLTGNVRLFRVKDMEKVMVDKREDRAAQEDRLRATIFGALEGIGEFAFVPAVWRVLRGKDWKMNERDADKLIVELWYSLTVYLMDSLEVGDEFKITPPEALMEVVARNQARAGKT